MVVNNSKKKREELLKYVSSLRELVITSTQGNDTAHLLKYLAEIENDICGRKFGLVFEEHSEKIDEILNTSLPVLKDEPDFYIDKGGLMNFLIEGDNLAALKILEKTHRGLIDIIYIDPPYNTGNQIGQGFIYDDSFVDPNDSYKHSKWLSFMSKRLNIAKRLLSNEGVIFIQIDDNEYANLKILCDQIYGDNNFLGTIIQNKRNAQNDAKNIQKNHEYILAYAKKRQFENGKEKPLLCLNEAKTKKVLRDMDGKCYTRGSGIVTGGQGGTLNARPKLGYTIYYNEKTNDKIAVCDYDFELAKTSNEEEKIYTDVSELLESGYVKIRPPRKQSKLGCWTWSLEKFNQEKNLIEIIKSKNGYSIYKKEYIQDTLANEYSVTASSPSKSIVDFSSGAGTTALVKMLGEKTFNNPKNVDLMKYLISLHINKTDATILDFFAGSGTTAQAVLELNAENEDSNRKFILCTSNDNNICREITYPRLKATFESDSKISGKLKYYKIDYVDTKDMMYYEYANKLLEHIKELVELENGIDFANDNECNIVLSDDELEAFLQDRKKLAFCKKLYLGQDVLTNGEQDEIIKQNGIIVNNIPMYYYSDSRE